MAQNTGIRYPGIAIPNPNPISSVTPSRTAMVNNTEKNPETVPEQLWETNESPDKSTASLTTPDSELSSRPTSREPPTRALPLSASSPAILTPGALQFKTQ
ncbi:hypothetical protein CDAR_239041 [Caerostris darwini]|uniref:Uncharacterized protein n=1 Tax=Caerostris darwini TaxID=1538125 RepID=A0AAV4MZE6_9ARAC|nr:hypothetical protein CDAR_239041 [Caerostris darwini]